MSDKSWGHDVLRDYLGRLHTRILDLELDHPGDRDVAQLRGRWLSLSRLASVAEGAKMRRLLGDAARALNVDIARDVVNRATIFGCSSVPRRGAL